MSSSFFSSRDEQEGAFRHDWSSRTSAGSSRRHLAYRKHWNEYQAAFKDIVARTSTKGSPWFIIPADNKWYRNWAVADVLVRVLKEMNPKYPSGKALPQLTAD